MIRVRHLYIHVPFCSGKCAYCAFYSVPYDAALADRFLDALARELLRWAGRGAVEDCQTLYIGGGTPSVLSEDQWVRLLSVLAPVVSAGVAEWTVEANPGTLTPAVLERMVAAGVNRISMGVQSFDTTVLQHMQRCHAACDVGPFVERVRAAGISNIGLDLIAGLPGVDVAGWGATVEQAIALEPAHISVYALGLEPGSALSQWVRRGTAVVPNDEAVLKALEQAEGALEAAGHRRYELSNYALPGRECIHNLSCWRGGDYIGFGPAAASRAGLKRWTHKADLTAYCRALEGHQAPPAEREEVDARTDLVERLMFGLRLTEGVAVESKCKAAGKIGAALWRDWRTEWVRLEKEGLLTRSPSHWKATRRGCDVLDAVLEQLVG